MRSTLRRVSAGTSILLLGALVGACDTESESTPGPEMEAFTLQFGATLNGSPAGCGADIAGLGPEKKHSVGVSDLRFYVSNLKFFDADGKALEVELDDNEFQMNDEAGSVALIDFTSNTGGSCEASAIAFAEGTARTNEVITGKTIKSEVKSISFDVGVPQALMKSIIGKNTLESAPSPLNEMYWNWASGYRHFVFNFAVTDGEGAKGGGYFHVGSRNCGPDDGLALADRDACEFVNTPSFAGAFDLTNGVVNVDLTSLLTAVDLVAPIYDPETFEVIGEGVGAECHSSPMQDDCASVFGAFGIDVGTGAANPAKNVIFAIK